jgi:hypothetical protein
MASFLAPWMMMSDGAALLLPGMGRGPTTSLLVAYKVVMLSNSSVVYLTMSFSA